MLDSTDLVMRATREWGATAPPPANEPQLDGEERDDVLKTMRWLGWTDAEIAMITPERFARHITRLTEMLEHHGDINLGAAEPEWRGERLTATQVELIELHRRGGTPELDVIAQRGREQDEIEAADREFELTSAQRTTIDEFSSALGYAPIVRGQAFEDALAAIGANGGVLLFQGEGFDSEYVVVLQSGALVPVDVRFGDQASVTIRLK